MQHQQQLDESSQVSPSGLEQQQVGDTVTPTVTIKVCLADGENILSLSSPGTETFHDIRQLLSDSELGFYNTCYYFSLNGKRINEFEEFLNIPGLEDYSVILTLDEYSEREVRIHLNRLREYCNLTTNSYSTYAIEAGCSQFPLIYENARKKKPISEISYDMEKPPALNELYRIYPWKKSLCLKDVQLSGWNPPPRQYRMKGHLMYLVITTLENDALHITCCNNGFYVNNCTADKFNPDHRAGGRFQQTHHSLVKLLESFSPLFRKQFKQLQEDRGGHPSVDVATIPPCYGSAFPWVTHVPEPTHDPSRLTKQFFLEGVELTDSLRDWNDDFQTYRELPKSNLRERVIRDQLLNKFVSDYTEAAIKGAVQVVEGNLAPLNPTDESEMQLYMHNNIFFSKGYDKSVFEALGGAAASHASSGKDLAGANMLLELDIEGISTLCTVVVDYKGERVICQNVVPGIFKQEEANVLYGTVDNGATIAADPGFHQRLEGISQKLYLAEHEVVAQNGEHKRLFLSKDCKGLKGTDGRYYLLDLYRMMPVDIEFLENNLQASDSLPPYPHQLVLLRPKLWNLFVQHKSREYITKKTTEYLREKSAEQNSEEKKHILLDESDIEKIQSSVEDLKVPLNNDAFLGNNFECDELKEHERIVREASTFLSSTVIPAFISNMLNEALIPMDGASLTSRMHSSGINMRYLGKMADLVKTINRPLHKFLLNLLYQEMLIRGCKHVLRDLMHELPLIRVSDCIAHFFNLLFGCKGSKPTINNPSFKYNSLTPSRLRASINNEVKARFRYSLPEDFLNQNIKPLQCLRELCLRVGIQLRNKDYKIVNLKNGKKNGSNGSIFLAEDILNVLPVIKRSNVGISLAEECLEASKVVLQQGDKQRGLELMVEAASLHEQIYGYVHFKTGDCYGSLGGVLQREGDKEAALRLQEKAVVINEKTLGLDHSDTIHSWYLLAHREHNAGNLREALHYLYYTLNLLELIAGKRHPESMIIDFHISQVLQQLSDNATAVKFLERNYEMHEQYFGKIHLQTARSAHNLTVAYAILGDYKKALTSEKIAYNIYLEQVGKDNALTKESDKWLQQLTTNAVNAMKKMIAEEKVKQTTLPKEPKTTDHQPLIGSKANLPIEKLLEYIEGPKEEKKRKPRKQKGTLKVSHQN